MSNTIVDNSGAWENGSLGRDENFVKVATDIAEESVDDALGLQLISIRLQKSLIEDLKWVAKLNGIGYQPLIRQVLTRFVNAEKKLLQSYLPEEAKNDTKKVA